MFADTETLIGQTVAGYRLLRVLGKGGMGAVFLGQRLDDSQALAAIKILLPSQYVLSETRTAFQTRFVREAKTLSLLHHPHIVPVLNYGKLEELSYIVMTYLPGGTLSGRIQAAKGSLPFAEIALYATQLASALDYAHAQGIVHRDIKPGNVLLDGKKNIFLSDFGIARFFDSSPDVLSTVPVSLTSAGEVFGTPSYMAPEIFRGEQAGPAADVYALGVMLYQLVTGHLPFQGKGPLDVGIKHISEVPLPARGLRPELPEPAEAALMRALAKLPAERFTSAGDFVNAFNDGLKGLWPSGISVRRTNQPEVQLRVLANSAALNIGPSRENSKRFPFAPMLQKNMRGVLVVVVLIAILVQALVVGIMMGTHSFGSSSSLSVLSPNLQKVPALVSPTASPTPTHTHPTPTPTATPTSIVLSVLQDPSPTPYVSYDPSSMRFAVSNTTVYAISNSANTIIWTYTTNSSIIQPPLVANNLLYLVTNKGQIYALQLLNGELLWSYATHVHVRSALSIENNILMMYATNGATYRFSAYSGNFLGVISVTPTPKATPSPTPTPPTVPSPTPTPPTVPSPTPTPPTIPSPTPSTVPSPTPTTPVPTALGARQSSQ